MLKKSLRAEKSSASFQYCPGKDVLILDNWSCLLRDKYPSSGKGSFISVTVMKISFKVLDKSFVYQAIS